MPHSRERLVATIRAGEGVMLEDRTIVTRVEDLPGEAHLAKGSIQRLQEEAERMRLEKEAFQRREDELFRAMSAARANAAKAEDTPPGGGGGPGEDFQPPPEGANPVVRAPGPDEARGGHAGVGPGTTQDSPRPADPGTPAAEFAKRQEDEARRQLEESGHDPAGAPAGAGQQGQPDQGGDQAGQQGQPPQQGGQQQVRRTGGGRW
jgi:hypothetical protein